LGKGFINGKRSTSSITRHTSHVTRHTSHVTRHTSPVSSGVSSNPARLWRGQGEDDDDDEDADDDDDDDGGNDHANDVNGHQDNDDDISHLYKYARTGDAADAVMSVWQASVSCDV